MSCDLASRIRIVVATNYLYIHCPFKHKRRALAEASNVVAQSDQSCDSHALYLVAILMSRYVDIAILG